MSIAVPSVCSGSVIKNIQRGAATIANSATSTTVSISTVDTTKAFVITSHDGVSSVLYSDVRSYLNENSINLKRQGSTTNNSYYVNIDWQVIEFN